jgi:hypothetical protein
MRQYIQEQLNAILDVGFASRDDTAGFKEVKHDPYVEALQHWLHSYGPGWAEQPVIHNLQGLNDRGVDLEIKFTTAIYSVGFQVKSYNDIDEDDFSPKIWQQIGQSGSYVVDHFYIILCGDMTNRSHYQKVRGFMASVEQGNYPEITVISPERAWQLYQSFGQPIDEQQVQSRLTNLARFLHAIGRQQELTVRDSVYANLERLYIPPTEYPEIRKTLETRGVVIIVGAPHLGKTFTAVNLLYEYYLQGYQPQWVLGRTAREDAQPSALPVLYQRYAIHDSFSIASMIEPGCIVYIEDPYGRTRQEELDFVAGGGRFEIGDLLHMLKRRSQSTEKAPKVVITSREGIFRHASQLQPELAEYAIWLKTGRGYPDDGASDEEDVSYDFSTRAAIAEKYGHLYDPLWQQITQNSPDDVKERVSDVLSWAVSFLWTPHSIQRFFQESRNMDWQDAGALKELVFKSANKSISESFASEIALLPYMQQLVFVVIYLVNYRKTGRSPWDRPGEAYDRYLALVQALGLDAEEGQKSWDQVVRDHATIIERIASPWGNWPDAILIRFAHPSYEDAVSRFLSDKPEVLESLFTHIRPLLQSESGTHLAQDMVGLLHHWHQGRPAREAQVLEDYLVTNDIGLVAKLAEECALFYAFVKDEALKSAILQIVEHPLSKASNSPIRQVFVRTAHIAKEMPIAKRCEILLAGLGDNPFLIRKTEHRPYDLVCRYYSEVTDEAREHLRNYLESDTNAWKVVGRSLGHYYDCLPPHLQQASLSLATRDDAGSFIARTELIKGLVLGFGQFNNEAHHLIEATECVKHFETTPARY